MEGGDRIVHGEMAIELCVGLSSSGQDGAFDFELALGFRSRNCQGCASSLVGRLRGRVDRARVDWKLGFVRKVVTFATLHTCELLLGLSEV